MRAYRRRPTPRARPERGTPHAVQATCPRSDVRDLPGRNVLYLETAPWSNSSSFAFDFCLFTVFLSSIKKTMW